MELFKKKKMNEEKETSKQYQQLKTRAFPG
jgi:hypothetical protein